MNDLLNLFYNKKIKHISIHFNDYLSLLRDKNFLQFIDMITATELILEGRIGMFFGKEIWRHDILNTVKISISNPINWSYPIPLDILSLINNSNIEYIIEKYEKLHYFS